MSRFFLGVLAVGIMSNILVFQNCGSDMGSEAMASGEKRVLGASTQRTRITFEGILQPSELPNCGPKICHIIDQEIKGTLTKCVEPVNLKLDRASIGAHVSVTLSLIPGKKSECSLLETAEIEIMDVM